LDIARSTSIDDVFINCPFDQEYQKLFDALLFTTFACGFRPRSAKEVADDGESRLNKIYALIEECRFGIHDISRTELDHVNNLPRFNMPFELGIFLGAKKFGNKRQKEKRVLIFDYEAYRYQKFISDIAGIDIHIHQKDPCKIIAETRDWLANVSKRNLPSAQNIQGLYKRFEAKLPVTATELGFDPQKIPYFDFLIMITAFLQIPSMSASD
jgi:hypothetical protein